MYRVVDYRAGRSRQLCTLQRRVVAIQNVRSRRLARDLVEMARVVENVTGRHFRFGVPGAPISCLVTVEHNEKRPSEEILKNRGQGALGGAHKILK